MEDKEPVEKERKKRDNLTKIYKKKNMNKNTEIYTRKKVKIIKNRKRIKDRKCN